MATYYDFPERFEACLESVAVSSARVRVFGADSGPYQYYGKLVSPDFEGMNEAERQRLVWDRILAMLGERDQERVAFVYTDAPSEIGDYPFPLKSVGSSAPASS
jgi:acid stress-induced BolA-like protein IbaG/YrbA